MRLVITWNGPDSERASQRESKTDRQRERASEHKCRYKEEKCKFP